MIIGDGLDDVAMMQESDVSFEIKKHLSTKIINSHDKKQIGQLTMPRCFNGDIIINDLQMVSKLLFEEIPITYNRVFLLS